MTFGHNGGFTSGGFGQSGQNGHRSPGFGPPKQTVSQPVPTPSTGVTLGWMAAAVLLVAVLGVGGAAGVNAVSGPGEPPAPEPTYTENMSEPQEAVATSPGAVGL